jgi:hypothetical protein
MIVLSLGENHETTSGIMLAGLMTLAAKMHEAARF